MLNLKKLIVASGATAVIAVMALTGCQTSSSSDRTAGRALDDKNITAQVEDRLRNEPTYKFDSVSVATFGGVVQLSGFVNTDDQKARAGEIARNVEGVSQVVNNITLKPDLTPTGQPR